MTLADRLNACHSSVVHDVMKDLGLPIRVLPRSIVGLEPTMRAAGPVFTVRGRPDSTLDKHTSLYEWAGLLSRAPAGHVVVCQPQDDTRALFGGLSAEALKIKGVRGYIVTHLDADLDGDERLALWQALWRVSQRLSLADRDGIVLIGAGDVEAVVAAAERKMATEGDMVRAIRAGEDPQAAYLRYRVF